MKTQIIQLERHDDIISARDKITWGKSARILLVWPRGERLLTRKFDLILLQRHAANIGGELGLVTHDAEVLANAHELGVPVFSSIAQAQRQRWLRERRYHAIEREAKPRIDLRALGEEVRATPLRWLGNTWTRAGIFLAGVMAVLVLMAFLLPSAQIRLVPKAINQRVRIAITTGANIQRLDVSGKLPAQLHTVVVEGQDSLATSGTQLVPSNPASGIVVFTNLTDQALEVPIGTVVLAGGDPAMRFATTEDIEIKSGSGQEAAAPATALLPGSAGNLPAGAIQAIEGSLGLSAKVTNPQATTGGQDQSSPAPSTDDRNRLQERLLANLRKTAASEIAASLNPGDLFLENSLTMDKILADSSDPIQNQPADKLTEKMQVQFSGQAVLGEDLSALADLSLNAGLPKGYHAVKNSLDIQMIGIPTQDAQGNYNIVVQAQRKIDPDISEASVVSAVLGLTPQEAGSRLRQAYALAGAPEIRLTPTWWPWMPFLSFRIALANR
jgi:hypothetical protein